MSTGKTIVSHAAHAISLEQLRRQAAEQAERERRRIGVAQANISTLDQRYRALVAQLDQAARKLPDLQFQEPHWIEFEKSDASAAELGAYASALTALVGRFEQDLKRAIESAKAVLAHRLALARAWRDALALEPAVQELRQKLVATLGQLIEPAPTDPSLKRPGSEASLDVVNAYREALQAQCTTLAQQQARAQRRLAAQHHAQDQAGPAVGAVPGARALLEGHRRRQRAAARAALKACLASALQKTQLRLEDLPQGTQVLLNAVVDAEEAQSAQKKERIQRLVEREALLDAHMQRARALLTAPPALVHAQASRSKRWESLVQALCSVAAGLQPLTSFHELEYQQIQVDAQRDIERRFVEAEFAQSLREQGLLAQHNDQGGLVIEDLRNLGVRFDEAAPLEFSKGLRGGMAAVMELKTDRELTATQEASAIEDICARLQAAVRSHSPKVQAHCVEVEHKRHIKRAPRQAKAKRSASL